MPHPTLQDKRKLFGLPEGALRQHLGARGLPAGACSGGLSANVAGMGNLPSKCRISALQTCKDGLLPALGTGLFYFRLRGLRPAGCTCLGCRSRRLPGASPNSGGYGRTGRAIPGTGKAPFREPNRTGCPDSCASPRNGTGGEPTAEVSVGHGTSPARPSLRGGLRPSGDPPAGPCGHGLPGPLCSRPWRDGTAGGRWTSAIEPSPDA